MSNVRIELDSAGIQELLKSSEIADVCEQEAQRMTRSAGMAYVADVHIGSTRVIAAGYRKIEDNRENVCPKCGRPHPNCDCTTQE